MVYRNIRYTIGWEPICDHGDDLLQIAYLSPNDFKEFGLPYYRRIVDAIPVPVFWHSEGYVRDYLPLAIEAGIRGIHGIEGTAGMNMGEIKREFGKDLVLMGNVAETRLCHPILRVRREVDDP
jgi:uroporphyrinogen decarboxylase